MDQMNVGGRTEDEESDEEGGGEKHGPELKPCLDLVDVVFAVPDGAHGHEAESAEGESHGRRGG